MALAIILLILVSIALSLITLRRIMKMSARSDALLAGITKNTDALKSVQVAVTGLTEGHSTIEEQIAALKAQIAAGAEPDMSALEAAVADQGAVIAGLETAIPARTPFDPSANR